MTPTTPEEVPSITEQEEEPRDWTVLGVSIALQPLSWRFGLDRSEWRQASLDLGPFRFTVAWP